jgi:hypothetical protein
MLRPDPYPRLITELRELRGAKNKDASYSKH